MITRIGAYRILEQVATGGMSTIYQGISPFSERPVALKVLAESLCGDRNIVTRFHQEAAAVAGLAHPHIIRILDRSAEGPPHYFAMEFHERGTLAGLLAAGPLTPTAAVSIILPLCHALDYAHQRGVIHRDLKPANVLFDHSGRPVLTDFGIARILTQPRLTALGMKIGTPEYMSPEQAKGLRVDHRSDLYSLGVVLYEMLAGRPPFMHAGPLETMRQVVQFPPPPLRRLNPRVPPALDAVVQRVLSKNPAARYPSGMAMARALSAALSPSCRTTPPARRRLALVLSLVVLAILAVLGLLLADALGGGLM